VLERHGDGGGSDSSPGGENSSGGVRTDVLVLHYDGNGERQLHGAALV
jgi:hypothetical protein